MFLLCACTPEARYVGAITGAPKPHVRQIASEADIMHGPSVIGKIGDWRLDNDRVAFIIDALGEKHGFAASGGNIVDAGRSSSNQDALNQTFLYLDDTFPRQGVWQKLTPSEDENAASIIVTGHDVNDAAIEIVHEYRLERGADSLTLITEVTNTSGDTRVNYELGDALQWGKTDHFAPGVGDELAAKRLSVAWIAGTGERVSYAMVGKDNLIAQSGSSWSDLIWKNVDLVPKQTERYERYLVVGSGDSASLFEEIARRRHIAVARVTGKIFTADDHAPVVGAEVWFEQNGHPQMFARSDAHGSYSASLPPGDYLVRAEAPTARVPAQLLSVHGEVTRDFALTAGGNFRFHLREDDHAIAGKIVVLGQDGAPNPKLGPTYSAAGAANTILTGDGDGEIALPVGHYRIFACHGIEYDVDGFDAQIAPRATLEHSFALHHVVDTTGYLSGDFHQHAANSFDSAVSLHDRALSNLAEGVEILVGTDHDFVTDYRPVLADMNASGRLVAISGVESTTNTIGHFMGFPMAYRPTLARMGAPETFEKTAGEIFAGLRSDPLDKVVQVNHPRAGATGYFDLLHLSFDHGQPVADENFDDNFDAIEAFNGKRIEEAEQTLKDWMAFAALGKRYTLTGNSDTHQIVFQEAGYPRNFVRMSEDLEKFDPQAFVDAVKRKHAVIVTNGPFVELFAKADGVEKKVGETLSVHGGSIKVRYRVQAAPWVDASDFQLWSHGEKVLSLDIPSSKNVVRFAGSFDLPVAQSGYVFAVVHGTQSLTPVLQPKGGKISRPFAFTNPIYLEKK